MQQDISNIRIENYFSNRSRNKQSRLYSIFNSEVIDRAESK